MSTNNNSATDSDVEGTENSDDSFCIFLHVAEGIGLNRKDNNDFDNPHADSIILFASLNGVKFEIRGHATESATIFNSNCVWECNIGDIKRMKLDNRPVKLEAFFKSGAVDNAPRKHIGSLLLPIRGLQTVSTMRSVQIKMLWHKLKTLGAEWRQNRPELYLLLTIVKKKLIINGEFETFLGKKKFAAAEMPTPKDSETAQMLRSQSNIYVQLLEEVGLIQVGNNPDVDCDILKVSLVLKQLKNLTKLVDKDRDGNLQPSVFVLNYDFLGRASQVEIIVGSSDCNTINEKITLSFKSSFRSLRIYFERIFYIPINLYLNGAAVATHNLDFSKLLPDDLYFNVNTNWTKNGTFHFDRFFKPLSPRDPRPSVDFIFSVQLVTSYAKRSNYDVSILNEAFALNKFDQKSISGDMEYNENVNMLRRLPYDNGILTHRNYNNLEMYEKNYIKGSSDLHVVENTASSTTIIPLILALEDRDDLFARSSDEMIKDKSSDENMKNSACLVSIKRNNIICNNELYYSDPSASPVKQYDFEEVKKLNETCEVIQSCQTETITNCDIGIITDRRGALDERSFGTNTKIVSRFDKSTETEKLLTIDAQTSMTSITVNSGSQTEEVELDTEDLTIKIVQELEDWKTQQKEHFLIHLDRKEKNYLADLDRQWMQQRAVLHARLEAKIAKCEELDAKLQRAHAELSANAQQNLRNANIVETVKQDIEQSYAEKFSMLEREVLRLKADIQKNVHVAKVHNKAVQIECKKEDNEKLQLKERVKQLEHQLKTMESTHMAANSLQDILADIRKQHDRFAHLEQSKKYYKEKWIKSNQEINKLKLILLKNKEKDILSKDVANAVDICLEEILSEEQEALSSDRSELTTVKNMLFLCSETSSTGGLDEGEPSL